MNDNEVPRVTLKGVFIEHELKPWYLRTFGVSGTRWCASVALELFDDHRQTGVAEWFYLFPLFTRIHEKTY